MSLIQLEPYTPLWFTSPDNHDIGEEVGPDNWRFGGSYWDARNSSFQGVKFEPVW